MNVNKEETLYNEFKRELTWMEHPPSSDKNYQHGVDELLKDIGALFNTINFDSPKQFVIGFDEKKQEKKDTWKKYPLLQNDIFKPWLIKKINAYFTLVYPENHTEMDVDMEEFIQIIKEDDLFYVIIEQTPFLLKLKEKLGLLPAKSFLTRNNKSKNAEKEIPEVGFMDPEEVVDIKQKLEEKINEGYFVPKTKKPSIIDLVKYYQQKEMPSGEIIFEESIVGAQYFLLKHKYFSVIFFYISNQVSPYQKAFDFLKNKMNEDVKEVFVFYDERNARGGYTNHELIKKHLNDARITVITISQWVWDHCALLNENVDNDADETPDFICPYLDHKQNALEVLKRWIIERGTPISIIEGSGGIGKTTLLRQFLKSIKDKQIVFITSEKIKDISNRLLNLNQITFMDLVRDAFSESQANDSSINLMLSSGNLLLVLDGLDEIINALRLQINTNEFFDSIRESYQKFFKTKVLISCRTNQWSEDILRFAKIFKLHEFEEEQVKQYFSKEAKSSKQLNKLFEIAKECCQNNGKQKFIPYILNLIKEGLIDNSYAQDNDFPKYLCKNNRDDIIIYRLCLREKTRQKLSAEISDQISVFIKIATYGGEIIEKQLGMLSQKLKEEEIMQHPILEFLDNKYVFKYDLWVKKFLLLEIVKKIKDKTQDLIFDPEFRKRLNEVNLYDLCKYFKYDEVKYLKKEFRTWIHDHFIDQVENKEFNANFFLFLLLIIEQNQKDIGERTALLEELYCKNGDGNIIENLCIINFFNRYVKKTFNLKGKQFINCYFENYENFLDCQFDKNTLFRKSFFRNTVFSSKNKSLQNDNFDRDTCELDLEMRQYLFNEKEKVKSPEEEIYALLNLFYTGLKFGYKDKDNILKSCSQKVFDFAIKFNILEKYNSEEKYTVSKVYSKLLRMFDDGYKKHPLFIKIVQLYKKEIT